MSVSVPPQVSRAFLAARVFVQGLATGRDIVAQAVKVSACAGMKQPLGMAAGGANAREHLETQERRKTASPNVLLLWGCLVCKPCRQPLG